MIRIELAGEPKGKGRPRFTRSGIAYTPAPTRNHEAALRMAAQEAMAGRLPLDGPLELAMGAYMPVPQSWSQRKRSQALQGLIRPTTRPDFDNLLKCCDALNRIVWRDDAQVVHVRCAKLYSARPRLVIVVRPAIVIDSLFDLAPEATGVASCVSEPSSAECAEPSASPSSPSTPKSSTEAPLPGASPKLTRSPTASSRLLCPG
jgi:Holliday junction resolvase RusA-like endonuclease